MQARAGAGQAGDFLEVCRAMANLPGASATPDPQRLQESWDAEDVHSIVTLLNECGVDIDAAECAAFLAVYRANLSCYRIYTPAKLSQTIDVSLYRATQGHENGPPIPPDYGWNPLLHSPIRIHDVEANHFSILQHAPIPAAVRAL
jgi:hypothetical protein